MGEAARSRALRRSDEPAIDNKPPGLFDDASERHDLHGDDAVERADASGRQLVVDTIRSAGDPAQVPGLRSINLLRSLDGTQVINHMHWNSKQAYEDARALPVVTNTRAAVLRLIEDAATHICERLSLS
jgi:heme-degrading monooxygenase HmoA